MKRAVSIPSAVVLAAMLLASPAQADLNDLLKALSESGQSSTTSAAPTAVALSQDEMVRGLKEALAKSAREAVARLGKEGGFLDNQAVKIAMPENLARLDKTLRKLGQGRFADQFVVTMNQAAEKAVPEAAGIFAEAIEDMSLEDARAILNGPDDAATQYFRNKSAARLSERFKPIVSSATDRAGVTAAYKKMIKKVGPLAGMLGAGVEDLDDYVTARSLDGLFRMVAEEEKNIRANPVARTSELLRKVFGGALR